MSVLFLVVPLATLLVLGAVLAFVWSARSGQFDDLVTPAVRMLHDDDPVVPEVKDAPVSPPSAPRR